MPWRATKRTLHHSLTLFKSLIADLGMNSLQKGSATYRLALCCLRSRPFRRLKRGPQVRFRRLDCTAAAVCSYLIGVNVS
jgi:hypothetical protein